MRRWLAFSILVLIFPITVVVMAVTMALTGVAWVGMCYLKLVDEALVENIKR
jgi:hypothetical protein